MFDIKSNIYVHETRLPVFLRPASLNYKCDRAKFAPVHHDKINEAEGIKVFFNK